MPFLFAGFEASTTTAVPNSVFNVLLTSIHNIAELKVVLYAIQRVYGFSQYYIVYSQFANGIGTTNAVETGARLTNADVQRGLDRAVADGFLACYHICLDCHQEISTQSLISKRQEGSNGRAGNSQRLHCPSGRCSLCNASLPGRATICYSLRWRDRIDARVKDPHPSLEETSDFRTRPVPDGAAGHPIGWLQTPGTGAPPTSPATDQADASNVAEAIPAVAASRPTSVPQATALTSVPDIPSDLLELATQAVGHALSLSEKTTIQAQLCQCQRAVQPGHPSAAEWVRAALHEAMARRAEFPLAYAARVLQRWRDRGVPGPERPDAPLGNAQKETPSLTNRGGRAPAADPQNDVALADGRTVPLTDAWPLVCDNLKGQMARDAFDTTFSQATPTNWDGRHLYVGFPSSQMLEAVKSNYQYALERAVTYVFGRRVPVHPILLAERS